MDSKRDLAMTAPAQQMRLSEVDIPKTEPNVSILPPAVPRTDPRSRRVRERPAGGCGGSCARVLNEAANQPIVNADCHGLVEHKLEGGDSESESKCAYVKVGIVKIDLLDVRRARAYGFRECMEKLSADLSNLAAHFDPYTGGILPGRRCYLEDFNTERHIAYIDEFLIETPWRESGLGLWLLSNLFHFESLRGVRFVFARPDVLHTPAPRGRAAEELLVQVGFRCVGDSQLFCMGKRRSDVVIIEGARKY
ncbi:hypothetical protein B0H14DRAFT_3129631 [Mycena olivaceomarginata]|nr:hypothetical protein B0H14DRAFT_3129631 [Mycena olivaceomarginata]